MSEDRINEVTTPGGRIAPRIARILSDAIVHTRTEAARSTQDTALRILTDFTNHVSDEVRNSIGEVFRKAANEPETPDELRALFRNLGHVRGQAFGWMGGAATSAAMGGGLLDLITNYLNPVTGALIAQAPHASLDTGAVAQAQARGTATELDLEYEAARQGLGAPKLDLLKRLSWRPPDLAQILELLNRGLVNENEAAIALQDLGLNPRYFRDVLALRHTPLSPGDAAAAQSRNLLSPEQVRAAAAAAGVSSTDADVLMGLAGQPPDPTDLIFAWRRGIITESDVDRGIVQGPIRNEWIPVVKALADAPLAPQEAAAAVTQGHLSYADGESKARLSGVLPDDFKTIVANAGRPPGIEFAAEAYNRGLITDAQWERMFLESAIKNEYIPLMRAMRINLLPVDTIRLMYRNGVYPYDAAVAGLRDHGLTEVDARAALALEDVRKHSATKDLSQSQVVELYTTELVSAEQAAEMLAAAGFDDQEVQWRLALAEVDRMKRFVNAAVSRVRSAYVGRRIDDNEALALLDQIGVHPAQRDRLVDLWDLERDVTTAQLTTAQIQAALRKGFIDPQQAYDRFLARGYSPEDADIIIRLTGAPSVLSEGE